MTRKITPARLDEIEAVAKKIPPGPWRLDGDEVVLDRPATLDDMAYLATMDPATTLALVAEVRELRAKVVRVREIIDGPDYAELQLDLIEEVLEEECWDAAHETPWTDGPVNPYREEA